MRTVCQSSSRRRATLSLGASLVALAIPGIAHAQTAPAQQTETERASVEDDTAVDEGNTVIIVTAQGRQQSLADVPVAVSAVSGELLEKTGASDIRELNAVAPSLLVSSTGNEANGSARIRGIGTVGDNPGLESSVAVFVDGVYRSRSGNALSELGPIDRIEILRGPQGTLGGRNSSAGLISIYTAPPEFNFSGYGNFTYGNYDTYRIEGGVNAPLSQTLAARVDGVYMKRDGFYHDVLNDTDVNNRDRYLVRGQLLFEPNSDLSVRIVGDYSKKNEACCAATFVQPDFAPLARTSPGFDQFNRPTAAGTALTGRGNPIIPVILALGQDPRALTQDTFDRDIYVTPGRSFEGETKDYGVSAEINYDLGSVSLTSITAYREYSNFQGSDTDYTSLDLLYRASGPDALAREFKTFSQELRLQGSLFEDRLDWLVGGYFANEDLTVRDNLRFGDDYGRFATCRVVGTSLAPLVAGTPLANIFSPGSTGCINPALAPILQAPAFSPFNDPTVPARNEGALIVAGFNRLDTVNDVGGVQDVYNQNSKNFAIFTHNIFHVTDTVDLTLGARYTHEKKQFDARFQNDNTICPTQRAELLPLTQSANRLTRELAAGLITLACQGNSTAELNGLNPNDTRKENEVTGTAILSWKPTDDLLVYGSYSRGYKAGGFNLDRSALTGTSATGIVLGPLLAGSVDNLQFDQETVDAFEVGMKYATRSFSLSLAGFYQEFSNFQLNTFNGSVFLVQNINGCDADLGAADSDADAATGTCSTDDVAPGVVAKGFELEASLNPIRDVGLNMGLTYSDTRYKDDLIGSDTGVPLDPALRLLPGDQLSNAPLITATSSFSWTPPIGTSGMRGLVFVNARMVGDYNTGSDLLYGKEQDGYAVVNARVGLTDIADRFSVELWAQNLFDTDYTQVAFNTPFIAPQQTYPAYLAEPRTYGVTLRGKF
ncbi:TonB-dependent receptor [Erythrobacter sp. 3-20A1M]|uniref:TonB-dependent receptor n=1 Tax=Erythrobacter sp. 3-20A1M TaxID=2653850 RepID=UPI001BFC91E2|nr:TonB-dependent receptor [Erythrobacter sp. 3-20A1M]QWC57706.1 TonB-dependent receptor [Erythrobacter sp. 3-20A1M]